MDARIAQEIAQLAMEMAGAGAENLDRWRWENCANHAQMSDVREIEWTMNFDGWIHGYASARYDCGALIAAIIRRSEKDTERILQDSPQSIYEQDLRGWSPLHLSYNCQEASPCCFIMAVGKYSTDRTMEDFFLWHIPVQVTVSKR